MKKLLCFAFLCLVLTSVAYAAPTIPTYRYQPNITDIKNLPANLILGNATIIDPWIPDEAVWPAGKRILLIVHGLPALNPGKCREDLIQLVAYYSQSRTVNGIILPAYDIIYVVEYPAKYHIISTAAALADLVHAKCARWPKGQKFDLFAHSMGGLVARPAIELPKSILGTDPINDRVAHLVMMGTPNNGFSDEEIKLFKIRYGDFPEVDDMKSPPLNGILNITSIEKPKVNCDYYMLVGTCSWKPKLFQQGLKGLADRLEGTHDGLVGTDSAGYDLSNFCHSYKKAELPVNHDYIKGGPVLNDDCAKANQSVFSAIDNWMMADHWFGATAAPISQPKITKFTGGVPMLLGKTQAEIERMFGKSPQVLDHDIYGLFSHGKRLYWRYAYRLKKDDFEPMGVDLAFSEYFNNDQNSIGDGTKVHCVLYNTSNIIYQRDVYPAEIVPKEILDTPPSLICRPAGDQLSCCELIIIWFIDNKTYCLEMSDSKLKLYTRVLGPEYGTVKYYLNDNGRNFRACNQVILFVCIDKIPNIFDPNLHHFNDDGFIEYPDGDIEINKFDG